MTAKINFSTLNDIVSWIYLTADDAHGIGCEWSGEKSKVTSINRVEKESYENVIESKRLCERSKTPREERSEWDFEFPFLI